jgi:AcrR family transcriptional regulator
MAIKTSKRVPRQRVPAPERRAQILDAALRCFAQRGYHTATMDDLAKASGLSKGSLYWHFDSKLEVILALFDQIAEEIFTAWAALERPDQDVLASMREGIESVFEAIGDQRDFILVWTEFLALPEGRDRMAKVYEHSRERVEAIVSNGIERGEFRKLDATAAATILVAAGEGLGLQFMVDPEFDVATHFDGIWDLLAGGMLA